LCKPEIARPHLWLKAQKRFGLGDEHLHMALVLKVSPYQFQRIGNRARDKHGQTLAEHLAARYAVEGKRNPLPAEPFLTTLWRLGNKAWKKDLAQRYPFAVPASEKATPVPSALPEINSRPPDNAPPPSPAPS